MQTKAPWLALLLFSTSLLFSSAIDLSSLVLKAEARIYEKGTLEYLTLIRTWPVIRKDNVLPEIIIQPSEAQDVVNIVKFVKNRKLSFAVKGGAHTEAAIAPDITIDMSLMKNFVIDSESKTAIFEPGVTMRDIDRATEPYGLAAIIGSCYTVGMGLYGFGGIGVLSRLHGLALDNIIYYDVVTADGELVRASDTENIDLFFALRGALPNFGISVSLKVKLYDVHINYFGGDIQYIAEPSIFKRFWQWFAPYTLDRRFSLRTVIAQALGIPRIFQIELVIWGDTLTLSEKQEILRDLIETVNGTIIFNNVGNGTYFDLVHYYNIDSDIPFSTFSYVFSRSTSATQLTDELIDALSISMESLRDGESLGIDLHGGAISDVPSDATAFFHRSLLYDIFFYSLTNNYSYLMASKQNFENLIQGFRVFPEYSVDTFYVNHDEYHPQRREAAYGDNLPRLQKIKAKWDPKRLFRGAFDIPPDASVCRRSFKN